MYCSNCGAPASGNFCSSCGSALPAAAAVTTTSSAVANRDWSGEIHYEKIIGIPAVKDMVSRHAAMAKKRMSADEFLAFSDKVIPLGVSLEKVGAVVQPIYAQIGLKTGQELSEILPRPPGAVIVSALCSMARNGQVLQQVRQHDDGCLLEATLPSDMWSFEGDLFVSVRRTETGTRVDGATRIRGQLFDWGKSKRCLQSLFSDIKATPA